MAERVGFEPTVPLLAHVISSHADSATLAPLREWVYYFAATETLMKPFFFWRGSVHPIFVIFFTGDLFGERLPYYHGGLGATSKEGE